MSARDSSRRPSNILSAKKDGALDNPLAEKQSARGVVKMPTVTAASEAFKDKLAASLGPTTPADNTTQQQISPRS